MSNFANIREIKSAPPNNAFYGFARGGNSATLRLGNNMPVRQYLVNATASAHELPTGFTVALDGFVFSTVQGIALTGAKVIPNPAGNGSGVSVTGVPVEDNLVVFVMGES